MFARSFLSYYGVQLEENHVFKLEDIGDGVYVLSLNSPLPKSRPAPKRANQ